LGFYRKGIRKHPYKNIGLSHYQNNTYLSNPPPVKERDFDAYEYAIFGTAGRQQPANSCKETLKYGAREGKPEETGKACNNGFKTGDYTRAPTRVFTVILMNTPIIRPWEVIAEVGVEIIRQQPVFSGSN
jgi:hypothetical protein